MLGKIVFEGDDEASVPQIDPNQLNLVSQVHARMSFLGTVRASVSIQWHSICCVPALT